MIGLSYQPTKDDDSTIHQEERFKGPKQTNPLRTHLKANYQGQVPWIYSGGEMTWKTHLKNVMNKAYRAFWNCNGAAGKT